MEWALLGLGWAGLAACVYWMNGMGWGAEGVSSIHSSINASSPCLALNRSIINRPTDRRRLVYVCVCTHAHASACMAHHHQQQQARYTTPNQAKSNSGQAAHHAADEVDRSSHYSGQPLAAIRPAKPPATHRRGHRPLPTPLAILINPMTTHRPTCRLAWGLDSPPRRANRRAAASIRTSVGVDAPEIRG